jgi:hypothetical protein
MTFAIRAHLSSGVILSTQSARSFGLAFRGWWTDNSLVSHPLRKTDE